MYALKAHINRTLKCVTWVACGTRQNHIAGAEKTFFFFFEKQWQRKLNTQQQYNTKT